MKKKFALLLVLLFIISACVFSLAACDKEPDDFEKYELYRYLTDYRFVSITDYEKDGETYKNSGDYNASLQSHGYKSSYDNIVDYRDGDNGDGIYNEMLLQARDALLQLGEIITIRRSETEFSGTLGKTVSELVITRKMVAYADVAIKWLFDEETMRTLLFDYEEEIEINDLIGSDPLSYFNVWVNVVADNTSSTGIDNQFKIKIRYSMFW